MLALLITFNVPLTQEQTVAILALITAASAIVARANVSPVAKLKAEGINLPE